MIPNADYFHRVVQMHSKVQAKDNGAKMEQKKCDVRQIKSFKLLQLF